MKKLLVSLATAACVIICIGIISVSAETYSGECGSNTVWTLDTDTGVLVISGAGRIYDYTNDYSIPTTPWSDKGRYIGKIIIEDGVTYLGNYSFAGCCNLTDVSISDSVTSIGKGAFSDCTKLTSLTIPSSINSIGMWAFSECTNIDSVYITNLRRWCNISFEGTYSNPMFYGADLYINGVLATDITIPYGVTSIGASVFYNCYSIQSVVIPDSVTSIGHYAFYGCGALEKITIPDSVVYIGHYAFGDTAYYKNADKWEDDVLYIGNHLTNTKNTVGGSCLIKKGTISISASAFDCCDDLTSVVIPDSVTALADGTFGFCDNLKSVVIPKSVTKIGYDTFWYCDSLTDIYYCGSEEDWKNISLVGYANDCFENLTVHYNYAADTDPVIPDTEGTTPKIGYTTFTFTPVGISEGSIIAILVTKDGISTAKATTYSGSDTVTFTIEDGFDYIKIMVWNSYENMQALTEYALIE